MLQIRFFIIVQIQSALNLNKNISIDEGNDTEIYNTVMTYVEKYKKV